MIFLVLGIGVGGLSALLRHRAPMVIALSASLAVGATLGEFLLHAEIWAVVAGALGSIVALQLSYVTVGLTSHVLLSRKMIPQAQAAIGQELQVKLAVPYGLPPRLSALVAQLETA
jgi:hypothetical protein